MSPSRTWPLWFMQCRHECPWVCYCGMWCVPLCVREGAPCGVHGLGGGDGESVAPSPPPPSLLPSGLDQPVPGERVAVSDAGKCSRKRPLCGPCSGSPSGNCSRREGEGSVEIGLRGGGSWLPSPWDKAG